MKDLLHAMYIALFLFFSMSAHADLQVQDGYVREMPPGQVNTAAFMRLKNNGDKPVVIIGAESARATSVELHRHIHIKDVMRMEPVAKITVPAHAEFIFKSGEYHVMLLGVKQPTEAGKVFPLTFITQSGERLDFELLVKPITAAQPVEAKSNTATAGQHQEHGGHHDHHH